MNGKKKVLVTMLPLNDAHLAQLKEAAGDGWVAHVQPM